MPLLDVVTETIRLLKATPAEEVGELVNAWNNQAKMMGRVSAPELTMPYFARLAVGVAWLEGGEVQARAWLGKVFDRNPADGGEETE